MKKILSVALVFCLLLGICSLFSGCSSTGRVTYLNPVPEADAAWTQLAQTFRKETGISVSIVTVSPENYDEALLSYMASLAPVSLYHLDTDELLDSYQDYLFNLSGTGVEEALADDSFSYRDQRGKLLAVGFREGSRWAVNGKASRADVEATVAFLTWVMTSPEGKTMLKTQFGDVAIAD